MRFYIISWLVLLVLFSCKKQNPAIGELIKNYTFSTHQLDADGSSLVNISVKINPAADLTKRGIIFSASRGEFIGGTDGKLSKKAEIEGDSLIARAQYKAPSKAGIVKITIKMDLPAETQEYKVTDSIVIADSRPDTIAVKTSAFSVMINFASEITVTGTLLNTQRKGVSTGYQVIFSDHYEDGTDVNGKFREQQVFTGSTSTVSAIYSPGFVAPGKGIWLVGAMAGAPSASVKRDSVLIYSTQN